MRIAELEFSLGLGSGPLRERYLSIYEDLNREFRNETPKSLKDSIQFHQQVDSKYGKLNRLRLASIAEYEQKEQTIPEERVHVAMYLRLQ